MFAYKHLVQKYVPGLDRQLPALGRGIPGIHDQIDDDLLDLSPIGLGIPQ